MADHIVWTSKEHPGKVGKSNSGNIRLFSIHWAVTRQADQGPWVMRTDLPGYAKREWRGQTEEELQTTAERLLTRWHRYVFEDATGG